MARKTQFGDQGSIMAPGRRGFAIVPGATELATHTRGIYVGGAGDLVVTLVDGGTVTLIGIATGIIHPIQASHVLGATTATGIVGFD